MTLLGQSQPEAQRLIGPIVAPMRQTIIGCWNVRTMAETTRAGQEAKLLILWKSMEKELIKEADSVLYNYIWNGKDKVKRLALISDIEMGGLKMLDIQSMICAKRITCLKKLLEDYSSPWKVILDKLLLPVGGRFVLHCNFRTSKLKISLPAYYKECFDAWSEVNGKTPSCYE